MCQQLGGRQPPTTSREPTYLYSASDNKSTSEPRWSQRLWLTGLLGIIRSYDTRYNGAASPRHINYRSRFVDTYLTYRPSAYRMSRFDYPRNDEWGRDSQYVAWVDIGGCGTIPDVWWAGGQWWWQSARAASIKRTCICSDCIVESSNV